MVQTLLRSVNSEVLNNNTLGMFIGTSSISAGIDHQQHRMYIAKQNKTTNHRSNLVLINQNIPSDPKEFNH